MTQTNRPVFSPYDSRRTEVHQVDSLRAVDA
jgi:hypothetical protein